jgi:hypothetical protein
MDGGDAGANHLNGGEYHGGYNDHGSDNDYRNCDCISRSAEHNAYLHP